MSEKEPRRITRTAKAKWTDTQAYSDFIDNPKRAIQIPAIERNLAPFKKRAKYLDFGCGPGEIAAKIARHGVEVVGVDRDKSMIVQAHKAYPHIRFIVSDGRTIPFDDDSFHKGWTNLVLMHARSKKQMNGMVSEFDRVTLGPIVAVVTHSAFVTRQPENAEFRVIRPFNYMLEGQEFEVVLKTDRGDAVANFKDIHWKLSTYFDAIIKTGRKIDRVEELTYSRAQMKKFGIPRRIERFPKVLVIRADKPVAPPQELSPTAGIAIFIPATDRVLYEQAGKTTGVTVSRPPKDIYTVPSDGDRGETDTATVFLKPKRGNTRPHWFSDFALELGRRRPPEATRRLEALSARANDAPIPEPAYDGWVPMSHAAVMEKIAVTMRLEFIASARRYETTQANKEPEVWVEIRDRKNLYSGLGWVNEFDHQYTVSMDNRWKR